MNDIRHGSGGQYSTEPGLTLQFLRGFNGFCAVAK
jgi:hypothetical protein